MSSAGNLLVAIIAARSLSAANFGAYGLVIATYTIVLGATRALILEPLLVRSPDGIVGGSGSGRQASGASLLAGLIAGVAIAAIGAAVGGTSGRALASLALAMPGLLVQDAWRFYAFACRRPVRAFLNDLAWMMAAAVSLATLWALDGLSLPALVCAWGVSGTLAALLGIVQFRLVPQLTKGWGWIRGHIALGGRFLLEYIAAAGGTQATLFGLAAVAGLESAGAVRGAQWFFGPINVVFAGAAVALIPEGVRLARSSVASMTRTMHLASAGFAGLGGVWLLVGLALPDSVGTALLGDTWGSTSEILLPFGLGVVAGGVTGGAFAGLRSLAAARASLRVRLLLLPLLVAAPFAGAWTAGAIGYSVGYAIAGWAASVVWLVAFRQAAQVADPH